MTFVSIHFFFFFVFFFLLYWSQKKYTVQNILLAIGSLIFYGFWSIKFLALMMFSTGIDFLTSILISKSSNQNLRVKLLRFSIISNIGILFLFKYYNFFIQNLIELLKLSGYSINFHLLNIILPIGISFYTFQSISYTIDVFKNKISAEKNYINYLCFSTFFPHLVAGPLMRAENLLPQIKTERFLKKNDIKVALWLLSYGFFLKIFIADSASHFVDFSFDIKQTNGITKILGSLFFGLQIYGDFCGYSLIAMGIAKLIGFNLPLNFNIPYASTSIRDFWRRWHITLGGFIKDYMYIPLGGNKNGFFVRLLSTTISMFLVGLCHGASWNFVIWGIYFGICMVINSIFSKKVKFHSNLLNPLYWTITMIFILFGWLLFRSNSNEMLIISIKSLNNLEILNFHLNYFKQFLYLSAPVVFIDFYLFFKKDHLAIVKLKNHIFSLICGVLIFVSFVCVENASNDFIYFQF